MRASSIFVFGLLSCLPIEAEAQEYFLSGNDIWTLCDEGRGGSSPAAPACLPAIITAYDMLLAFGYRCDDQGASRDEIAGVILEALRDKPETRNRPAVRLIQEAAQRRLDCRR